MGYRLHQKVWLRLEIRIKYCDSVADNATADGRAANRRVELRVLED